MMESSELVMNYLLVIGVAILGCQLALLWWLFSHPQRELTNRLDEVERGQERAERLIREEFARNRDEANRSAKDSREELAQALDRFMHSNEQKLDRMRATVEERLMLMQTDNAQKLEKMREVVDEKLQSTLEQRLGESFKLVSERLEQVHRGLGEMQALATGVGDLKRVLSSVKARGTWGEIQLGSLLEQMLTLEQYDRNVVTKTGANDRVEFAIRLPGRDGVSAVVWLPIDAKFPRENYERLLEAQDAGDARRVEESAKLLESAIKVQARKIREKYLDPPQTTDFALLFLPTEGLYAEVLRRPGLFDHLQSECRIIVTGPTTLCAILNSLQMGFRTLAIEQRTSEVWALLGAVKTEFGRFGEILQKTKEKLDSAAQSIDTAAQKSRVIQRKLKAVEEIPAAQAKALLRASQGEDLFPES
ncbi:MAG TPA: DNA recombination protein RmuC [Burkholderiales bacterium]|nr:DNA recombination protein RmuC [Burkholderiales bacterium]